MARLQRTHEVLPAQLSLDDGERLRLQALMQRFTAYADYRRGSPPLRTPADGGRRSGRTRWSDSSIKVYVQMWKPFASHLAALAVDLQRVSSDRLDEYLALRANLGRGGRTAPKTAELNGRYAWRLLWLIDEITRFDARARGIAPNEAAAFVIERDYKTVNERDTDPRPVFLNRHRRAELIERLQRPVGSDERGAPKTWMDLRDNAAVAVQLGAGLTPGEVRALRMDDILFADDRRLSSEELRNVPDISLPQKLYVRANGNNRRARDAQIERWAAEVLLGWMRLRAQRRFTTPEVFCTEDDTPLHKNSVDLACDAVLQRCGIVVDGGHFRLRHSYVMMQLANNEGDFRRVAHNLGVKDANRLQERYAGLIDGGARRS